MWLTVTLALLASTAIFAVVIAAIVWLTRLRD